MTARDTTITLLIRANAAALNAAMQQAGQRTRAFAAQAQSAGRQATQSFAGVQRELRSLLAAYVGLQSAQGLARVSDEATNLQGRLRLATKTQEDFNAAYQGVLAIAQATRQPLAATVDLYARMERSTRSLHLSQAQLLGLTQTIGQAVALSFAGPGSAEAALMQFGQGLSAGRLGGEELNSVIEQTPRLAEALQAGLKQLGVEGAGNLKKLAEAGKLGPALVLRAIQTQAKTLGDEFSKLPPTIGGSLTQLRNAFTVVVGDTEKAVGAAGAFSREIAGLASFLANYHDALSKSAAATREVDATSGALVSVVRLLGTGVLGLRVAFQVVGRAIAAFLVTHGNLQQGLVAGAEVIVAYSDAVQQAARFDFSGIDRFRTVTRDAWSTVRGLAAGTAEVWRSAAGDMAGELDKSARQIALLWSTSADPKAAADFSAHAKAIASAANQAGESAKKAAEQLRKLKEERDRAEQDKRTALANAVAEADIALLRASGHEVAARRAELTREYGAMLADLERLGDQGGRRIIARLIDVEEARAQLTELEALVERVFGAQERSEQSISTRQQAGLLTELAAQRELVTLHARTAQEVEALLPLLDAAAAKTGDPAAIDRVRDLATQITALKLQTNEWLMALQRGFEGGLQTALEGLATRTLSVREALLGLVQDMIRSLAQLAAQQLAAAATAKLMKMVGGQQGPDLAAPDPAQAAAAGIAYAAPIGVASGALSAAGGIVLLAAKEMQSAAAALLAANVAGSASSMFAEGGFTGAGPKHAPAGVVHHGEFVHRREVVRQSGARAFLERFNRIGMQALPSTRGYADGGLVGPAPRSQAPPAFAVRPPQTASAPPTSAGQITNVLYLDPREVVNVMGTAAGRQVILSTIRTNAPTVRQDLGVGR